MTVVRRGGFRWGGEGGSWPLISSSADFWGLRHVVAARDLFSPLICLNIPQKTLSVYPKCGQGQPVTPTPRAPDYLVMLPPAQCHIAAQYSLDLHLPRAERVYPTFRWKLKGVVGEQKSL